MPHYRSDHPDILAYWDEATSRWDDWHKRLFAFMDGYPKHSPMCIQRGFTRRLIGLDGPELAPPWRRMKRGPAEGLWVPDRRTKMGRTLAAEFEALRVDLGPLPGMPAFTLAGLSFLEPGVAKMGEHVWVSWSDKATFETIGADAALWEEQKPSAYHLAREAASTDGVEVA